MDLYLFRHARQTGPYTEADARALVAAGEIERTCLAWREGLAEWIPVEQVLDLSTRSVPTAPLAGLPPVPVQVHPGRRVPDAPAGGSSTKPMKLGTKVNVYGGQAISVAVGVLLLLRFLASCHHL